MSLWLIAVVAIGIAGLFGVYAQHRTARSDRELLKGIPAGIAAAVRPAATLAERRTARQPRCAIPRNSSPALPETHRCASSSSIRRMPQPDARSILDMHGGGYVYGSPEDSQTALLDALVLKLGITAVSVDYRLAPATRYPALCMTTYAALRWFHENAAELGVDPQRIATIGASAGGGHAAALAIHARDQGEFPIRFQALCMSDAGRSHRFHDGSRRGLRAVPVDAR